MVVESVGGEMRCKCDSSAQLDLSKTRCVTNNDDCGEGGKVVMEADSCQCMDGYATSLDSRSCVMLQPCGDSGVVGADGRCVCKSGQSLHNRECVVACPTGYIAKDDVSGSRCVCDVDGGYVASLDGSGCVEKTSLGEIHQIALSGGRAACAAGFATSVDRRECVDVLGGCGEYERADAAEGACVCAGASLVVGLDGSGCVTRGQCRADEYALDYPLYCECVENSRFSPGKNMCMKTIVTGGLRLSTEPAVSELCVEEGQKC